MAGAWLRSTEPPPLLFHCVAQKPEGLCRDRHKLGFPWGRHFHPSCDNFKNQTCECEMSGNGNKGWHVPEQKSLFPMPNTKGPHSQCLSLFLLFGNGYKVLYLNLVKYTSTDIHIFCPPALSPRCVYDKFSVKHPDPLPTTWLKCLIHA